MHQRNLILGIHWCWISVGTINRSILYWESIGAIYQSIHQSIDDMDVDRDDIDAIDVIDGIDRLMPAMASKDFWYQSR